MQPTLTKRASVAVSRASHDVFNFVRIHKTLRMTPAVAAGVSDRLWEIADITKLVENADTKPAKRGPYRKLEDGDT